MGFRASPVTTAVSLAVAAAAGIPAQEIGSAQEVGSARAGEELAGALRCGACHAGVVQPGEIREQGPSFGLDDTPLAPDFVFSYLADPVTRRPEIAPARMPDFRLSEPERLAFSLYLGREGLESTAVQAARARHPEVTEDIGRSAFVSFGCQACHEGPERASSDDGGLRRIGPDLSNEGARVRLSWLSEWLRSPTLVRPSGATPGTRSRMPDFRLSDTEADDLTAYLSTRRSGLASEWVPTSLTPSRSARARRLLDTRLACFGCHRIDGLGGKIGPPLEGIAERLHPTFVRGIILDPQAAVTGSPMPRQEMRPEDAELIASYLLDTGQPWSAPDPAGDLRQPLATGPRPSGPLEGDPLGAGPDDPALGEVLYSQHCASCHGKEGRGDGWNVVDLRVPPTRHADSALMSQRPDDTLFDGIHGGGWVLGKSPHMPAFGELLSTDELRALVAHIRVLCACTGPSWSRGRR